MMYPFLTLDDETEIVHSNMLDENKVKVYVERPDEKDGFHHLTMYLPTYEITESFGFTEDEIHHYEDIIRSTAHLIMEFSKEGGFENASSF